jgi:hypothetical protein
MHALQNLMRERHAVLNLHSEILSGQAHPSQPHVLSFFTRWNILVLCHRWTAITQEIGEQVFHIEVFLVVLEQVGVETERCIWVLSAATGSQHFRFWVRQRKEQQIKRTGSIPPPPITIG